MARICLLGVLAVVICQAGLVAPLGLQRGLLGFFTNRAKDGPGVLDAISENTEPHDNEKNDTAADGVRSFFESLSPAYLANDMDKLVKSAEVYTVKPQPGGNLALQKEEALDNPEAVVKAVEADPQKKKKKKKPIFDFYNTQPYDNEVTMTFSTLDGLLSGHVSVDTDSGAVSAGGSACGATCAVSERGSTVGVELPSVVPFVTFSAKGVYSTQDGRWVGKVVEGGLDFIFFSVKHIQLFQNGTKVKTFDKLSILGISVAQGCERIGGELVPVTRDVSLRINTKTPFFKVTLQQNISPYISKLFGKFKRDWIGTYSLEDHRNGVDVDKISNEVAGGEVAHPKKPSKLKKMWKTLKKKLKKAAQGDGEPVLVKYRTFDESTAKWTEVDLAKKDSPPVVDPLDHLTDTEGAAVATSLAKAAKDVKPPACGPKSK